jgi:hypothetical protein
MGREVSDEWTVPLCATHHRSLHNVGDDEKWWKERQIDPIAPAERFWQGDRNEGFKMFDPTEALVLPGVD